MGIGDWTGRGFVTDNSLTGSHFVPIPDNPAFFGQIFCTQAATVRLNPLEIQLQNAIDITIGL